MPHGNYASMFNNVVGLLNMTVASATKTDDTTIDKCIGMVRSSTACEGFTLTEAEWQQLREELLTQRNSSPHRTWQEKPVTERYLPTHTIREAGP